MKSFTKYIHYRYFLFLPIVLGFVLTVFKIINGEFPLWYDNARDLLLAQANLSKISLIGPTGGIPGIFYGPYWIWLLSGAMAIQKDPRFITFMVMTLPYFVLFPLSLFLLRRTFSFTVLLIMWSLFVLTQSVYFYFFWNPHLFPVTFLLLTATLQTIQFKSTKRDYSKTILVGILTALTFQFSISIGTAVLIGTALFVIGYEFIQNMQRKTALLSSITQLIIRGLAFCFGSLLIFSPFILFEIRHGFHQIQTFITAFSNPTAITTQQGFSQTVKITFFMNQLSEFLSVPNTLTLILFLLMILSFAVIRIKKTYAFNSQERTLFFYLICISTCILLLYLKSKNAIWDYHFIGVEVIFMLLIGLILNKIKLFVVPLLIWIGILVIQMQILPLLEIHTIDTRTLGGYGAKKNIAEFIIQDNGTEHSSVFTYSPSIYTYDYDYLFSSLKKTEYLSQKKEEIPSSTYVYLIIPETTQAVEEDFIQYTTPSNTFITVDQWQFPDKTKVYKREKH